MSKILIYGTDAAWIENLIRIRKRAPPTVGRSLPVLFENEGRHEGTLFGRTPYMQAVRTSGPARLVGQEVQVNITAAGTNSLKGKAETL